MTQEAEISDFLALAADELVETGGTYFGPYFAFSAVQNLQRLTSRRNLGTREKVCPDRQKFA
jgi:hypothetical protein